MAKTRMGVPITRKAVIARINRALRKEDELEQLRVTRGARAIQELGEYHTINHRFNGITGKFIDVEAYAREMGVLSQFERMVG